MSYNSSAVISQSLFVELAVSPTMILFFTEYAISLSRLVTIHNRMSKRNIWNSIVSCLFHGVKQTDRDFHLPVYISIFEQVNS